MDFSDFTATDLQNDIIGPIIVKEYREQVTKRMTDDNYMNFLAGYTRSVFQDFEIYLRTEVDLVEGDSKLVLDEYNSSSITYELQPSEYRFEDITEAILQSEYPEPSNVIVIENNDTTRKTKLVVKNGNIALRFDEKSSLVLFWVLHQVGIIYTIMNTLARKL